MAHGAPLEVLELGSGPSGFPRWEGKPITWVRTLASDLLGPSVRHAIQVDCGTRCHRSMDMTGFSLAAVADFEHPTHGAQPFVDAFRERAARL